LGVVFAAALTPRQQFIHFQHKYEKVYSAEEFLLRYDIFKENLKRVEKMNAGKDTPVYGVTKFFDLTPAEFKEHYLMKRTVDTKHLRAGKPVQPVDPKVKIPGSWDWRTKGAVTPVYNQGQCGSCWAFSTTENIESMWNLAGHPLTQLSMQQIVDCDTSDDGCGGGDPPTAYQYVMSAGGMDPLSDYPYTAEDGYCNFQSSEVAAKISNWQYATQDNDENVMAAKVVSEGPLSICVDAASWQYYNGGIIMHGDGCGDSLDHCVQIVGYATSSDSTPYWIVRNSWGTDWGEQGYLKVERGYDVCGISDEATYAVIN
jgi:cathepsin F